jgi:hypothetical protein
MDLSIVRENNMTLEKKIVELQYIPFHVQKQAAMEALASHYRIDSSASSPVPLSTQVAFDGIRKRRIAEAMSSAGEDSSALNASEIQTLKEKLEETNCTLRERTGQLKILMDSLEVLQFAGTIGLSAASNNMTESSGGSNLLDTENLEYLRTSVGVKAKTVSSEASWTTQSLVKR